MLEYEIIYVCIFTCIPLNHAHGGIFLKQTVFIVTLVTVEIQLHFLQGQTIHTNNVLTALE